MMTHPRKAANAVLDSWSSISKKTVFVLDRSNYFTQVSSGHAIVGDFPKESKKTSHLYVSEPPIEPFDRSLWTCTIEAVAGYSRIVWDLFSPEERCISILSVNPNTPHASGREEPEFVEKLCTWQDEHQNLDHLLTSLGKTSYLHQVQLPMKLRKLDDISSAPNCGADSIPMINALDQALSELVHPTCAQSMKKSHPRTNDNNGRIILISSFQDERSVDEITSIFQRLLMAKNDSIKEFLKNQSTSVDNGLKPINYCDLVIVNTFPMEDSGPCSKISNFDSFKPNLHINRYSVSSGRCIAGLLNNLCLQHHNLRSTTITGIPMKEEQNARTSSQYDVEIVHCSSIHEEIITKANPQLVEDVVESINRNGFPCETFKLSWCTPKYNTLQLDHCVATSRITAVDVNSRPSACLTNFLLNGRAVMLEIFKSKSNRTTTHMLASHNGQLYIHSLAAAQSKLSISEGPAITEHLGGKVGDYRMNDFIAFMKQNTLTRVHTYEDPLSRTLGLMRRQTLYWPISLGHTILLNVPHILGKIIQIIPKETLAIGDVEECKRSIDLLAKSEKSGTGLPSVSIVDLMKNVTTKGSTKLELLYKLLWNELEHFLRVHASTPEHEAVLEYLMDKHGDKRQGDSRGIKRTTSRSNSSSSLSPPLKRASLMKSNELLPEVGAEANPAFQQSALLFKSGISLWNTWTTLYHVYHKGRSKLPFFGRNPQQAADENQKSKPSETT